MRKYKLRPDETMHQSQITLTSYMVNEPVNDIEDHTQKNGNLDNKDSTTLHLPQPNATNTQNYEDKNRYVQAWLTEKVKRGCTRKFIYKRIPILKWLPRYTMEFAVCDLIAGISVGLTIIPHGISYANVAGLPPQVGLYSCFMACFVYTIFGSVKDSSMGPTAISALLTKENIHNMGVNGAVLLCFMTGCVELLMGVLQMGFLIDFISGPVSIGFTSAAAIIIATTQLKDILGLSFQGGKFLQVWKAIFEHIGETKLWDALLGFSCIMIILLLKRLGDVKTGPCDEKKRSPAQLVLSKFVWFFCMSRNIIVVVCCGMMGYFFELYQSKPFSLIGYVKPGLPTLAVPPFTTKVNNETLTFADMTATFGSGILVVSLIAILENIALAKAFSGGKRIDATQEMLALGLGNIVGSFVGSMPITGGLSRGAVNNASGAKTTFGGVYTGIVVLMALYILTPYFRFIPKASLAAVIVAAVVLMIEVQVIKPIWRTKKSDLIPALGTFVSCLFLRLELGIVIGIGINLIFLLYASARPYITVEKEMSLSGSEYILITPDRSLSFPSVEYVRSIVSKAGEKQGSSSIPVVIDAKHIQGADFTTAKVIKSLIEDFVKRGQPLFFYNLKPTVIRIFQGVQPKGFVCCHNYNELDALLKEFSKETANYENIDVGATKI